MTTPPDLLCLFVLPSCHNTFGWLRLPGVRAGLAGLADCPAADTGSTISLAPLWAEDEGSFWKHVGRPEGSALSCSFPRSHPPYTASGHYKGDGRTWHTALDLTLL